LILLFLKCLHILFASVPLNSYSCSLVYFLVEKCLSFCYEYSFAVTYDLLTWLCLSSVLSNANTIRFQDSLLWLIRFVLWYWIFSGVFWCLLPDIWNISKSTILYGLLISRSASLSMILTGHSRSSLRCS
jgi:hypothetical protein